jgi:hypothetical protein
MLHVESDDMAKTKVFVSFDFDNDRVLKEFVIGQAKLPDSPFDVIDGSLKEAAPEPDWLARARRRIAQADVFMVMLGPQTARASGVLKEVAIANELGKRKFQVVGYRDGSAGWAIAHAGQVYRWSWPTLKNLLA